MEQLPLVNGVLNYINQNNISFSMPGHKGAKGLENSRIHKLIYDDLLKLDITEVDGVDNLHKPEGIIKNAQEYLSNYYGSDKSYFLINGSTVGNLVMIFSCFNEGDKIIVERNCHKSIFNAIILKKLVPVYVKNIISKKINAPLSIDMEHFSYVIQENTDAKGVVITYPNYYGTCCDLRKVIEKCKRYNIKVLVDSAHGAHFEGSRLLPQSAVRLGADMVVMSAHKTLPALNQAAFLHLGKGIKETIGEKVKFYLDSFMSTSPSYMMLCSMDYSRYYLEKNGEKDYENLIFTITQYEKLISKIPGFNLLEKEIYEYDKDITRLVIYLDSEYSGYKLYDYLLKNHIQCEMSTEKCVVLIITPFNTKYEMEALYKALIQCNLQEIKDKNTKGSNFSFIIPQMKYLPHEVLNRKKILIKVEDALGKVSGENIIPYPPGVPILMMGEIITQTEINMIKYYISNKNTVIGVNEENYICIVEEN